MSTNTNATPAEIFELAKAEAERDLKIALAWSKTNPVARYAYNKRIEEANRIFRSTISAANT